MKIVGLGEFDVAALTRTPSTQIHIQFFFSVVVYRVLGTWRVDVSVCVSVFFPLTLSSQFDYICICTLDTWIVQRNESEKRTNANGNGTDEIHDMMMVIT